MIGKVTKYFDERAFGFVLCSNRQSVFFHLNDIEGRKVPEVGNMLDFETETDAITGRTRAVRVRLLLIEEGGVL